MGIVRFPYRWLPSTILKNVVHAADDIVAGVGNVFRWMPVIWHDRDYDWCFLAKVMEYKLRRSAELELTVGHHVGSKRDGRRMLVCAELLRRLQGDEYFEEAKKRFGQFAPAAYHAVAQQKQDQRYLGHLIGKYLTHWWD